MTRTRFYLAAGALGLGLAAFGMPLTAEDEAEKPVSEQDIKDSLADIIFVPHDVGAPEAADAGGVRGIATAPKLHVLAPDSLSRSLSPSPTLYWYLSKATESPVRFTLIEDDPSAIEPILDVSLGSFDNPGIYAIPLSQFGVQLEAGQRYAWSVGLSSSLASAYSTRPTARTWLEHYPSPDVQSSLVSASPLDQTDKLARHGYWFDAIDVVSRQIKTGERTIPWHEVRAHLLDQVGLDKIALYDRLQSNR